MALPRDTPCLDIDDPSTWPSAVLEPVRMVAEQLRGTTELTNDLNIPLDDEDDFHALLSGWLVRAFHATRLLDHEVQMIRAQGLRPLSVELIEERINNAFDHSCVSEEERDQLRNAHVFATGETLNRAGEVSLFFPERDLAQRPEGFENLLAWWGGEAISRSSVAQ